MCWQYVGIGLSLIITIVVGQSQPWFYNCDKVIDLEIGKQVQISNYGFPTYGWVPDTSCRYIIRAPGEYQVDAVCDVYAVGFPGICEDERFFVGLDGDKDISNAEFYCGSVRIANTSISNQMTLAYISTEYSGQFNCTLTPSCDCGWGVQHRIVGGSDANPNEFPPMAALFNPDRQQYYCGATLVSSRYALSAAHCVNMFPIEDMMVVAGLYEQFVNDTYTAYYKVEEKIPHPKYIKSEDYNDVGLVKIVGRFEWGRAVSPACLPFLYAGYDFANRFVQATGWGTITYGGKISDILQKVDLQVISNTLCNPYFKNSIQSTQMCTYAKGKDSCQYDSGGPLWYRGPNDKRLFNIGVISYGDACGLDKPSVNSRTTEFLPWIQSYTGPLCNRGIV